MRLHRLISILLTVENRGRVTAAELAEQFETSTRTIYRDLNILGEAGIPIVAESGPHGGISLVEGYQTGIKRLQKEEILYLFLNGMGLKAEGSSDLALKITASLGKLQKSLSAQGAGEFDALVTRFYVDDSPWWGKRNPQRHIDTLIKATWESHKLDIRYRKVDQSISERVLRPYGIVVKDRGWYLVAYCESSRAVRTFKCERIEECELLPDVFGVPQDFSLERYFKTSIQQFQTNRRAIEQYAVTLRLHRDLRYLLEGREIFSLREDGDELEAVVNMYSFENALNDFWNLLARARVVEPMELRRAVRQQLKDILDLYGG